ncbi:MAG: glycoside hydrolase family 57 protein [Tepidisphaeraceae bacterium]
MPKVCLYFQLHQPYRLRRYSVFDTDRHYFDDFKNVEHLRKVCQRCYLPANQILLEQIRRHPGEVRLGFSLSGVLLEQLETHFPEVLASFKKLAETGCVEFLNETYYHSLAFLYSRDEFRQQVQLHRDKVRQLFGQDARIFRNTELIYNNELAEFVADMGYVGCLAEGVDASLGPRSANVPYTPPGNGRLKILLNNYRLTDQIAFQFTDASLLTYPLTAAKFAEQVGQIGSHGQVCNLFLNYEVFGEHFAADTGILTFLDQMPEELLKLPGTHLVTPSQAIDTTPAAGELNTAPLTSWADEDHDLSTWLGNAMQSNALHELFKLESKLKQHADRSLLTDWRKLGSSDHFYYMCTKHWGEGKSPRYPNPYESPYDSYINFMNVLDNIQSRLR